MPSPIGHALAGLALGMAVEPADPTAATLRPIPSYVFPIVGATMAALPDADLLLPYFHRMVTHSVGATALVMIVTVVVTGQVTGRVWWRLALLLGLAHASHIVVDWLAADPFTPSGIQALWPFSSHFYVSGWNWFPPTERRLLGNPNALAINLRALLAELATMGPIAAATWLATRKRRIRARISVRDLPPPPSA